MGVVCFNLHTQHAQMDFFSESRPPNSIVSSIALHAPHTIHRTSILTGREGPCRTPHIPYTRHILHTFHTLYTHYHIHCTHHIYVYLQEELVEALPGLSGRQEGHVAHLLLLQVLVALQQLCKCNEGNVRKSKSFCIANCSN